MAEQAAAVLYFGVKSDRWRGVIDDVEDRGTHTSGTRVWRCHHEHRTETAAVTCAGRELRRRRSIA